MSICKTSYFGFRSKLLKLSAPNFTRSSLFKIKNEVSAESVSEIRSLMIAYLGEKVLLLGSQHAELFPGAIIMKEREKKLFDLRSFYGNDSFGQVSSENFFLTSFVKAAPSSIVSLQPSNFIGACAMVAANLAKKGSALLAFDCLSASELDSITFLSSLFSQTILSSKFVCFLVRLDKTDCTDFIDFARAREDYPELCFYKKNLVEEKLISIFKKLL